MFDNLWCTQARHCTDAKIRKPCIQLTRAKTCCNSLFFNCWESLCSTAEWPTSERSFNDSRIVQETCHWSEICRLQTLRAKQQNGEGSWCLGPNNISKISNIMCTFKFNETGNAHMWTKIQSTNATTLRWSQLEKTCHTWQEIWLMSWTFCNPIPWCNTFSRCATWRHHLKHCFLAKLGYQMCHNGQAVLPACQMKIRMVKFLIHFPNKDRLHASQSAGADWGPPPLFIKSVFGIVKWGCLTGSPGC